jgi:hypothetical protein
MRVLADYTVGLVVVMFQLAVLSWESATDDKRRERLPN